MADYPTGRSRKIRAQGAFSGHSIIEGHWPQMAAPYWNHNYFLFTISAFGAVIRGETVLPVTSNTRQLQLECWTGPGLGGGTGSGTKFISHTFTDPGTHVDTWDVDFSVGTWSVETEVDEYISVTNVGDFPTYGGAKVIDPPYEMQLVIVEKLKIGANFTVTCDMGSGLSATATTTNTSATVVTYGVSLNSDIYSWGKSIDFNMISTQMVFTPTAGGGSASTINLGNAFSASSTNNSASCGDGISAHADIISTAANRTISSAVLNCPKAYSLSGVTRAGEDTYPGSVTYVMDRYSGAGLANTLTSDTNGGLSDGYTQKKNTGGSTFYSGAYGVDNFGTPADHRSVVNPPWTLSQTNTSVTVDEYAALRIWLQNAWLVSSGEDTRDWRVGFKGLPYTSFTLTQAANKTVAASFSGTGPTNLTHNLPDGSTDASLKGSSFTGASLEGYRFLRLNVQATQNASPFKVVIGSKEWTKDYQGNNLVANTSAADVDIDLCSPTNATDATDSVDTKWPLPTVDGTYFGVTAVTTLTLGNLANGVTYTVNSTQVVRHVHAKTTFWCAFDSWINSGASADYRVRSIQGDTDGRESLEMIDFSRVDLGGGNYSYTINTLSEIITNTNGGPGTPVPYPSDGWTATAAGSFPSDGYHNNSLPGCFAWGSGAVFQNGVWSFGFNQDATSSQTVIAQPIWDSVDFTPECGDVFNLSSGAWGGPITLRTAKALRGQAWGLAFRTNSLPLAKARVVVTVASTGALAGIGITDRQGIYRTGLAYGKGNVSHKITLFASVTTTFRGRKRHRASFRGDPACQLFIANPVYFPFQPQFSDQNLIPVEEWRRIPPAASQPSLLGQRQSRAGNVNVPGAIAITPYTQHLERSPV